MAKGREQWQKGAHDGRRERIMEIERKNNGKGERIMIKRVRAMAQGEEVQQKGENNDKG